MKQKNKEAVKWGSQGGKATLKNKGKKFFSMIAKKRWVDLQAKSKK